jgi:hypothetical protein
VVDVCGRLLPYSKLACPQRAPTKIHLMPRWDPNPPGARNPPLPPRIRDVLTAGLGMPQSDADIGLHLPVTHLRDRQSAAIARPMSPVYPWAEWVVGSMWVREAAVWEDLE